jgi:hypothetical protein
VYHCSFAPFRGADHPETNIKVKILSVKNEKVTIFNVSNEYHPIISDNYFRIFAKFPKFYPLAADSGVRDDRMLIAVRGLFQRGTSADVEMNNIIAHKLIGVEQEGVTVYKYQPHRSGKYILTGNIIYVWHDEEKNLITVVDSGLGAVELSHGYEGKYEFQCAFDRKYLDSMIAIDRGVAVFVKSMISGFRVNNKSA